MENLLTNDNFYNEMYSLLKTQGMDVIETRLHQTSGSVLVSIYVTKDGVINSDDLESAYNIVFLKLKPRYQKRLTLEISTPGVSRNIKDAGEFKFFITRSVRIYYVKDNAWIRGIIESADEKSVTLRSAEIEDAPLDKESKFDEKIILFTDIKKARLIDNEIKEKI